jgi:hypothetical protein
MNDPLSELARKIRSKKLNKEEIENLKKEAIESKIERNRRIKKAIEIQRIIRGYLARKKFKILEDKININTIIEYLNEKKVKRIHKHSSQIISYFIYKYIERQRKIKTQLIEEFKIHCSDVIKAFIRGVILRKKIKNELELIHNSKQKIIPYILSFKTRLILKSRTLQNILMDIANIKFLLQDENEQNQSIQDKQSIKDLKLKLRKKYNEFYLIYYQFKMTYEWVDEERTPNPWLQKYQQILNGEDVSFMKKETNDNINKPIKEKSQRKNKKQNYKNKDNNSSNIPEFESENNLDSNYNEEYENNEMNLNNDNYNNNQNNQKIIYKEDERPIKPMKNNNFMNSQNPFGLAENGFPEDHSYNINNNNIKKKSQRTKIKRNKMNKNDINNNEEEKQQQIINQDNYEENNNNINSNNNMNKNYSSYDERPIGGNKIDYNAMFDDNNINIEADGFGGANQQININNVNKKKIIRKNSPKKKPVYDARKAIEEAKLREAKEGKKEKPSAFREFVKEMKKLSAEEKAGKMGENSPKLSHKSSKVNNQIKVDTNIKNNNYIEENIDNYQNNEEQEQNKEKRIPVHKRKQETKDMIMRKKLHQLEQSPPPMLNIKGIKSKIECWGPSNDTKKQKNNKNLVEKDNKRITNINKKNNIAKIDSKDEINIINISKKETEMKNKNKEVDMKKIEEKLKKNAIKRLVKIESQINRIDNEFNIDSYFQEKDKKMEEFGKIPYIKKDYNYVKRYSNDIYPKLVKQLISMYQELK